MKKLTMAVTAVAALAASAGSVQAQSVLPFAVDVRAGLGVPTGDFGDGVGNAFGFGVDGYFRVAPLVSVYGGWDRYSYSADESVAGGDADAVDSGFRAGAQVKLPLPAAPVSPYVLGGLTYGDLETTYDSGALSGSLTSDKAVGYEVGAGLQIGIAPTVSLTPQVRYRSRKAKYDAGEESAEVTASNITFDVGVRVGF